MSPSIVGSDVGCGMRLLATNKHYSEIEAKDVRRLLIQAIEHYVPMQSRPRHYQDANVHDIVVEGVTPLPFKYQMDGMFDIENVRFDVKEEYLAKVPSGNFEKAHAQLGSLGGGNHFIEIQVIEINEVNADVARQWGLFDGQVVIMIHSGSRAWGALLGRHYNKLFKPAMNLWGIENPDPQLIYAPIQSPEGQEYINLMYSALNFAVANRHMIGYGGQEAFKEVLGDDTEVRVVYDLMHNYALKEFHGKTPLMVHRKGSTRALPAGHFMNPTRYKNTGHPALIPSSGFGCTLYGRMNGTIWLTRSSGASLQRV